MSKESFMSDQEEGVASDPNEMVLVVCLADLVNPDHTPVFASDEPQRVSIAAVAAFPSKFADPESGDPFADDGGSTEPTEEEVAELTAAIEYAEWEEAANYAQALEDEAAKETAEAKTGKQTRGRGKS